MNPPINNQKISKATKTHKNTILFSAHQQVSNKWEPWIKMLVNVWNLIIIQIVFKPAAGAENEVFWKSHL